MSEYNEEPQPPESANKFNPRENLGGENTRDLIHLERNTTLDAVKIELRRLQPLLNQEEGVCFFRSYPEDAEYQVLIMQTETESDPNYYTIVINKRRGTEADEPSGYEGQALELTDLVVCSKDEWSDGRRDLLYRSRDEPKWDIPKYATLIEKHDDCVKLLGAMQTLPLVPRAVAGIEKVECISDYYWEAHRALSMCNEVTLEEIR